MFKMKLFLVVVLLLLASVATNKNKNFKKNVRRTHNQYRKKHGVSNLKWDSQLVQYAKKRCEEVAEKFEPRADNPYGENLEKSWGSSSVGAGKKAVESWYEEVLHYDYSNPGNPTDKEKNIKHFTQVVWKKTKKFGCGEKKAGSSTYVCCVYDPPGNVEGEYEENVLKPDN